MRFSRSGTKRQGHLKKYSRGHSVVKNVFSLPYGHGTWLADGVNESSTKSPLYQHLTHRHLLDTVS
jgi:hypothetical protein